MEPGTRRLVKHRVGTVDEFEPGTFKVFAVGSRSIGVVNAAGAFYAVLNVCPHEHAPIAEGEVTGTMLPSGQGEAAYGLEGRVLRCPWHGYEFDLDDGGRCLFTRFRGRLRMFPVSVQDGEVLVALPERWRGDLERSAVDGTF
jgi:nitrite reductase (NADH) small subunit